jgi:hypothetical protein
MAGDKSPHRRSIFAQTVRQGNIMQTPTNYMIAKETDQPYFVSLKTNINSALLRLVLCKQLKYYLSYTVFTVH